METVRVYKVRMYDIQNDELRVYRRMATEQGAAMRAGTIVEGSMVEISPSQLEPGMQWTARDFSPRVTVGFQRQVI